MKKFTVFSRMFLSVLLLSSSVQAIPSLNDAWNYISNLAKYELDYDKSVPVAPAPTPVPEVPPVQTPVELPAEVLTKKQIFLSKLSNVKDVLKAHPYMVMAAVAATGVVTIAYVQRKTVKKYLAQYLPNNK